MEDDAMYIVDTNIHAAYLLQNYEDDTLTKQYLKFYSGIALSDRVVTDFILGEFETFMIQVVPSRYKLGLEDVQQLKQLSYDYIFRITHECTIIVPEVSIVQQARDIYFKNANTHYMSFVDCLILACAYQNRLTLFSKDGQMNTTAKKLQIECYEP